MELDDIVMHWTYCYHVTFETNLASICQSHILCPAQSLLKQANRHDFLRRRRARNLLLRVEGRDILIRNQYPLAPESLDLGATGTLEEYVECLNSYVYFWPGTASGPVDDGIRMFYRTNGTPSVVIRIPTCALINANQASSVYVSTCNTGAAWTAQGLRSRRSPEVFQPFDEFSERPANIQEICFAGRVCLPEQTGYSISLSGPWRTLCGQSRH